MQSSQPRPLFLYGTLRALPLLAWAILGDATQVEAVQSLVQPARVEGYTRFSLRGKDYPAVVKQDAARPAVVDGLLFQPRTTSQRKKLDDFEGETYTVTPIRAQTIDSNGEVAGWVDADMYLWGGDLEAVSEEPWDLGVFIRERLDDWLDLFGGMEMVGDDEV